MLADGKTKAFQGECRQDGGSAILEKSSFCSPASKQSVLSPFRSHWPLAFARAHRRGATLHSSRLSEPSASGSHLKRGTSSDCLWSRPGQVVHCNTTRPFR
jgi:hypothetical protein